MRKAMSLLLTFSLLVGIFTIGASASEELSGEISDVLARRVAVFYLATYEPVGENAALSVGDDFEITGVIPLCGESGEEEYCCVTYTGDNDGYVVVSCRADLPYILSHCNGTPPFFGKTYFTGDGQYFCESEDNSLTDSDGERVTREEMHSAFSAFEQAQIELSKSYPNTLQEVADDNRELLIAVKAAAAYANIKSFFLYCINEFRIRCDYYIGDVYDIDNLPDAYTRIEQLIADNAGEGYALTESFFVDKQYMKPHGHSYYADMLGIEINGGICGLVSVMMVLSFYRDGKGYDKLPDDATMCREIYDIYTQMREELSFFFDKLPELFGEYGEMLREQDSFGILGTNDIGMAYYLYSKGYVDAAKNVAKNLSVNPNILNTAIKLPPTSLLRDYFSHWLSDKTDGKLRFTPCNARSDYIVRNSLEQGEPLILGNLAALADYDIYGNHYVALTGYFKTEYEVKVFGVTVRTLHREYVEAYNTWSDTGTSWAHCDILDWSIFKYTSLHCVNTLADIF